MSQLISVCIPTYNGARYVEQSLRSVLGQQGVDLEVVVADDGSTDDTLDIVTAMDDDRVRLLPPAARYGVAANWTRAMVAARGTYIKVMGQDDLLHETCLQEQSRILTEHADVALVSCRRDVVGPDDRLLFRGRGLPGMAGLITSPQAVRRTVAAGTNVIGEPVAGMFRRDTVSIAGGFSDRLPYVIDLDYWFRLLEHGALYAMPEALVSFRISSTSWSVSLASDQSRQMRRLFALARRRWSTVTPGVYGVGCVRAELLAHARRLVYRRL